MSSLIVQFSGLSDAISAFDKTSKGAWKRGLMVYVGNMVRDQTKRRISSEKTSPSGQAWAKWTASTAARRNGGHSLLVYTGKLLGSIYSKASASQAAIGTDVPYGGFIQEGTGRMVAREFLGLSSQNEGEVTAAVNKFIAASFS